MKCDICKCDTYIIYINAKHEKVCMACRQEEAKDGVMAEAGGSEAK